MGRHSSTGVCVRECTYCRIHFLLNIFEGTLQFAAWNQSHILHCPLNCPPPLPSPTSCAVLWLTDFQSSCSTWIWMLSHACSCCSSHLWLTSADEVINIYQIHILNPFILSLYYVAEIIISVYSQLCTS